MKRIFLFFAAALACLTVRAQTPGFMKLYETALATFSADGSAAAAGRRRAQAGDKAGGIVISEFSGRMLRAVMPRKSENSDHMVNRIEMIRQIKFPPQTGADMFRSLRAVADGDSYERLSIMNVDGESVYIYTAPYKDSGREFLIFIVKDDSRLVCDIVGDVTMKDVLDLIYGRA